MTILLELLIYSLLQFSIMTTALCHSGIIMLKAFSEPLCSIFANITGEPLDENYFAINSKSFILVA